MLWLIIGIVVVGGITRLTGSGLSMVDWQPIMGILPPLTDTQWSELFSAYKQSPEYQKINMGISLSKFKFIFFWEYIHRIFGRIIGLAAILPYGYFLIKGRLSKPLAKFWPIVIILIGCQGFMGWYMVKSGLVDNPHVSHLRLAAHLSLAFIIFTLILWQYLKIRFPFKKSPALMPKLTAIVAIGIGIQIIYGAFMAGLHAGYYYNTYPKMGDHWIPPAIGMFNGFVNNILNNPITVQWIHRWLAIAVVIGIIYIWKKTKLETSNYPLQISGILLLSVIGFQFLLGVLTLITVVWLPLAILHQLGGLLLIASMTLIIYFSNYYETT